MKSRLLLVCMALYAVLAFTACKKESASTKITSLEFKKGSYELLETEDINLKKQLVAAPEGIMDICKVSWTISDENMGHMDGSYFVPDMPGDVKVTATIQGMSATCQIEITEVPVSKITLTDMTVPLNSSAPLECEIEPAGISVKRLNLSSSDDDIARVDYDGEVYGKGSGTATITAEADGVTATCKVTVYKIAVESITLSETSHRFSSAYETFTLTAKVNPSDASYPNVKWASSDGNVAIVDENGKVTCISGGTAEITATADGVSATCTVSMPEFGEVTDCQNNTYKTVKIGNQWWMAENLRVTAYSPNNTDCKSLTLKVLSKNYDTDSGYTPCCIDASNKSNWYSLEHEKYTTDSQVKKYGYLYNWAAAVGVADAEKQEESFYGNRQGICPDGWHVPTIGEWYELRDYVFETGETYANNKVGKHLKSVLGWYTGYSYKPGDDSYGFTALPAGRYEYSSSEKQYMLNGISINAVFWSASVDYYYPDHYAENVFFSYYEDCLKPVSSYQELFNEKECCNSIRCVKD